jgi:putative aldouronate transport system substrate-binding protein
MADWYSKGLINPDFMSQVGYISIFDKEGRENGKYGITYDCFVYMDGENAVVGGDYRFGPLAMPIAKDGDKVHVLGSDKLVWPGALGISTSCKNVELACRYWDYLYSDEGSLYANYGKEGETLEFDANGQPHLNDFAKNNKDMNLNQVENYYTLLDGPFYRHMMREFDAISENELRCGDEWTKGDGEYNLPSNLSFTADEGTRKAQIMSDLDAFVAENQVKFVTGQKPMSEFDSYIDQIKSLGIEEVVKMYEDAFARYNNRMNLIKK